MSALIPKTFLITGVSSGLGRAFAEGALDAGHAVVGTCLLYTSPSPRDS